MAAAASNKATSKKDIKYPEIVEDALQFILDSCESSISKYSKFLQVVNHFPQYYCPIITLTWIPAWDVASLAIMWSCRKRNKRALNGIENDFVYLRSFLFLVSFCCS